MSCRISFKCAYGMEQKYNCCICMFVIEQKFHIIQQHRNQCIIYVCVIEQKFRRVN